MIAVQERPKSLLAEAYRGLRTSLEYSSVDKKLKILVITSAEPAEGKSTVCCNLAFVLTQGDKKVIIVDCDLRKPSIYKKIKISNDNGLTDYLVGKVSFTEVINKVEDNVHIITSGKRTPNPAEMVSSKAMDELLGKLKEYYDYVIIDTPPIKIINDGLVLAAKADGTIYVVRSEKTKSQDIIKGYKELESVNANIIGTVLNGVLSSNNDYYYYYDEE